MFTGKHISPFFDTFSPGVLHFSTEKQGKCMTGSGADCNLHEINPLLPFPLLPYDGLCSS